MIGAIPIVDENRIREAMQRGEFDQIEGAGRPFTDLGGHYDSDWWIKKKLQREGLTEEEAQIIAEKLRAALHQERKR
jgi:hypothetical protein